MRPTFVVCYRFEEMGIFCHKFNFDIRDVRRITHVRDACGLGPHLNAVLYLCEGWRSCPYGHEVLHYLAERGSVEIIDLDVDCLDDGTFDWMPLGFPSKEYYGPMLGSSKKDFYSEHLGIPFDSDEYEKDRKYREASSAPSFKMGKFRGEPLKLDLSLLEKRESDARLDELELSMKFTVKKNRSVKEFKKRVASSTSWM